MLWVGLGSRRDGGWRSDPRVGELGAAVDRTGDELTVTGVGAGVIGDLAHQHRLRLHQLATRTASLEAAFLGLTVGDVEYAAGNRP